MMIGECAMRKRLTSFLLCFFLCVSLLPVSAQATETAEVNTSEIPTGGDVWDGSITQPTTLVQKDGVYYYEITKCSELAYVAQTGGDWLTYNYILGNNLILNDVELTWDADGLCTNEEELLEWTPIGPFQGILEGNNYTISGLYIDAAESSNMGLFSALESSAQVLNLSIINAHILGKDYLGGICGDFYWEENVIVERCVFDGCVKGVGKYIGGISGAGRGVGYCKNYGSIYGQNNAGGISGSGYLYYTNIKYDYYLGCVNYGNVVSEGVSGGIVAYAAASSETACKNCENHGSVQGSIAGGIAGQTEAMGFNEIRFQSCINTGSIVATETAGGICGYSCGAGNCINWGSVTGVDYSGGIIGKIHSNDKSAITECANMGNIYGENNVGGICGAKESTSYTTAIENCYNTAEVSGTKNVGGIVGYNKYQNISNCYSVGIVKGENDLGHIAGYSDHIWGTSLFSGIYYLKRADFGGVHGVDDAEGVIESKSEPKMKLSDTYVGWNFDSVWDWADEKNNGYPYFRWQEALLSNIKVNAVQISETALILPKGDSVFLSATVSPVNASNPSVTWSSSDKAVATITAGGKVTAVGAGTATITATTTDGGYTATCTVTVTERLAEEYKINSITVRNNDGTVLSEIPSGSCLATVSITNLASEGNTLVFLAAYTSTGQYQGMMWVSVEDLPIGATIKVTLPVDNADGKIENLKAFTVASFSNLTPLGEAVSFLP